MIMQAGREVVPGETSQAQKKKVEDLQKAEAVSRRKMKDYQSKKKGARRSSRGGDD